MENDQPQNNYNEPQKDAPQNTNNANNDQISNGSDFDFDKEIDSIMQEVKKEQELKSKKDKEDRDKELKDKVYSKDEMKKLLAGILSKKEENIQSEIQKLKDEFKTELEKTKGSLENMNERKGMNTTVDNPFRDNGSKNDPFHDPNLSDSDRAELFLNLLEKGPMVITETKDPNFFDKKILDKGLGYGFYPEAKFSRK